MLPIRYGSRMADGIYKILTRTELARLANLTIGSRFTVEGNLQGAHRSPLKGFSVEFADYRQYVPGDDLRHLDWKAYGRNERLYIRQYEEECNLRTYLLLDASASMQFGEEGGRKVDFARRLAAALAYVTVNQQDSVGLSVFSDQVHTRLPARSGPEHLRVLSEALAAAEPSNPTDLGKSLHSVAAQIRRRALVVLISDLLDEPSRLRTALANFRRRKHDVIVYHIADSAELRFPFRDTLNFEDLESGRELIANPREVRDAYLAAVGEFLTTCRGTCAALDVDYLLTETKHDICAVVRRHLSRRARSGR